MPLGKVFIGVLFSPNRSMEKLIRCIRSIENQKEKPFDFDVKIIVNTDDSSVTQEVNSVLIKGKRNCWPGSQ